MACFSVGLALFAFASQQVRLSSFQNTCKALYHLSQHAITSALTAVFTVFSSFGLAAVSLWFALESWVSSRYEFNEQFWDAVTHSAFYARGRYIQRKMKDAYAYGISAGMNSARSLTRKISEIRIRLHRAIHRDKVRERDLDLESEAPTDSLPSLGTLRAWDPLSRAFVVYQPTMDEKLTAMVDFRPESPTARLRRVVRMVITIQTGLRTHSPPREATRSTKAVVMPKEPTIPHMPAATLRRKLNALEPSHDWPAHAGLVRHLQFSPSGSHLASAR